MELYTKMLNTRNYNYNVDVQRAVHPFVDTGKYGGAAATANYGNVEQKVYAR